MQELVERLHKAIEVNGSNGNLYNTINTIEFEFIEKEKQMITKLKTKKMYGQLQDIEEDYKCSCCGHSEFEIKND